MNTKWKTEVEESDRLKKAQSEALKQSQQLEVSLRELQERLAQLESGRLILEQEKLALQTSLEVEKRERSVGSETINDLQGECMGLNLTKADVTSTKLLRGGSC